MLIIGEAWGEQESATRQPFVGTSGAELWRMLGEAIPAEPELHQRAEALLHYGNSWIDARSAWLEALGIAFTNVFNFRPPSNNLEALCTSKLEAAGRAAGMPSLSKGKYLAEQYFSELDRLMHEIGKTQPRLLVLAGNTACWALLHATNIGSIRGTTTEAELSTTQRVKCLPTYHPAGVLRQWSWRPIVVADLIKAWREAQFPELNRPRRLVLVNPSIEEVESWTSTIIGSSATSLLSCDIETGAGQIKCVGFASSVSDALVIPFVDQSKPGWSYWDSPALEHRAWDCVSRLLGSGILKVFQNGLYDLQYLGKLGFRPINCIEDTMLLHHSIHPEMMKGLGFLGSIYTNESSWKLMRRARPDSVKRDE
jgi:uracil-DNA glycosylase